MDALRQAGSGLLFGLVCLAIVVGGFALSMAEAGFGISPAPGGTASETAPSTPVPGISTTPPTQTFTQSVNLFTGTPLSSPTFTPPPPPTNCPPPAGWVAVTVQWYDTLPALAQTHNISAEAIRQANCLLSDQLVPGSFLYLPPLPTATLIPCGAPAGWVNYIVQSGDTLFSISQKFRVSVADLQRANCLGNSTFIQAGKILKVPNVPTSTPQHSPTPSATFIIIREETFTPTLTDTPTLTASPATTEAPSATAEPPTSTPAPTATP